jgi:hypothetical protein
MTGLAPISNAAAVGANSALAASSGAPSADSQRPTDFSAVLGATANIPQTAPAETPSKNVVAAQTNSSRLQKAPTAQTNSLVPVVQARPNVPATAPVVVLSALAATASAAVPPPVPPATAASLNLLQAESESPAAENVAVAAQAVAASSVPAQPVNPADAADSRITNAALAATIIGVNDSVPAQADATQADPLNGIASVAGDSSAAQSATDVEQRAELQAGAEVAATISSAIGLAAAGNRSQVDSTQAGASRAGSAQPDTTTAAATSATTSAAKPAATPEAAPKPESPQTALPAQSPATPKQNPVQPLPQPATAPSAPSVRTGQNSRPVSQAIAPETVAANATAANASLQKAISDARDKLVQAIDANLQAEISAAPTKGISSANPANGGGGNSAGQNAGNPSFNSSAQDLLKQYGDAAMGIATNPSGHSSDQDALSANNSPSAVTKAAGLLAAAMDPVLHVMADASQQSASTTTAPTASQPPSTTNSASPARPEPPPPLPLPQSLPQSLGDVAKASELYQRVGGSEMHIAMETDLLGAVDLRATMHQSALTATIGVQRADVQALLSNELPVLQHALADKNFHVEQISVLNNSVGGRAGSGGQQDAPAQNQHPFAPRAAFLPNLAGAGAAASNAEDMRAIAGASSMAHAWSDDSGRISVHV